MVTKRELVFSAIHEETGLSVEVYRVDCFVESHGTEGLPEFSLHERYYETQSNQRVLLHNDIAVIVETPVNRFFLRRIK